MVFFFVAQLLLFNLCSLCFTSMVGFTGFYTKNNPQIGLVLEYLRAFKWCGGLPCGRWRCTIFVALAFEVSTFTGPGQLYHRDDKIVVEYNGRTLVMLLKSHLKKLSSILLHNNP